MKTVLIYLAAALSALFLQTTVLSHLPVKPDLVLILVVCLGLSSAPFSGALLAFLLGCLTDVFAGSTPGFFALTMTVIFFLVIALRSRLYFESTVAKIGLVFLAALVEAVMLVFLTGLTSYLSILPSSLGRLIVGPVLFTALFAPVCFMVLKRVRILAS
ncbi:MAG: rod shape-determining protein MreD [Proteobacteria bacterium]|nr:rod shape-determining protein MreD [Pseudomonadota bacterium]